MARDARCVSSWSVRLPAQTKLCYAQTFTRGNNLTVAVVGHSRAGRDGQWPGRTRMLYSPHGTVDAVPHNLTLAPAATRSGCNTHTVPPL